MAKEFEHNQPKQPMVKREKKAQSIAGDGLVKRSGDKFCVSAPSSEGHQTVYDVRRDESGFIRCNCPDYKSLSISDPAFRCEHILSVRYALAAKNTESYITHTSDESVDAGPDKSRATQNGHANTTGVSKMTQENPQAAQISTSDANNVLNFTNSFRESRNNVAVGGRNSTHDVQMVGSHDGFTLAEILDEWAPNWTYEIRAIQQFGNIITVAAAISIEGVTREGIGTGSAESETGIKLAEQEAMNRAAAKFGISTNSLQSQLSQANITQDAKYDLPLNPMATSISDLITARQLGMIRALSRENSVDANYECRTLMSCQVDELSQSAASGLIRHLQDLQNPPIVVKQKIMRRAG